MAIRKDLDDMLNSLMEGGEGSGNAPARSHNTPRAPRKSRFDDMSVDDLLQALEEEKLLAEEEQPIYNESPAAWKFASPSEENTVSEPVVSDEAEEVPNIISEVMHTEASAEMTRVFDTIPVAEELPKPVKKKKIVITGELPDYEALRREEQERERQAQRAAEAAAEEARAAERARRAAEVAAERERLEEEARQRRLAMEEAERLEREREEAEMRQKAEEAAEQARLAEEAENARLAAEQQRRIDEMKRLAEEAVSNEAAPVEEQAYPYEEQTADNSADTAETAEKPKKIGFFKKLMSKSKDEAETAAENESIEAENSDVSATELIDAAIAAINNDESETAESDPVGSMLDNIREDAAEKISDLSAPKPEEVHEQKQLVMSDEDVIAGLTPELKERFDALDPDKQRQVIEMRRSQMGAVAPPVDETAADEETVLEGEIPETDDLFENIAVQEEELPAEEATNLMDEPAAEKSVESKPVSKLEAVLGEDPKELIAQRSEHTEPSAPDETAVTGSKKRLYTTVGIVLSVFALIGIIASIFAGVKLFRRFTSGEVRKDSFTQMIYPATIMDIEPFGEPSQLTSEQIITATIWSIIMDQDKVSNYELKLDTVSIPDVDVEKYAVELFGENIPEFTHVTVGPVESRFYYSDGAYNVKVNPITHTYVPEIKTIVKSGKEYTLKVDYIAELPQWMEKTVAKQAEYKLTEKDDGTFRFDSMKITSVNNGNL